MLLVCGVMLLVSAILLAQAQITVDASMVTCEQFVHFKVGNARTVAIWFSEFNHRKHDIRTYDPQAFEENMSKLQKFCYQEKNFNRPLMQAIEDVFGAGK